MPGASATTPLLDQYEGVKARFPGHLVLFRVGDFYETFGDDAKLLAHEVDVALTARGADAQGVRVPMAGVPYHAVDSYLGRLVRKGYKVAVCDQVEDARLAKGLVRRDVTRVVTPGTVVDERILGGPDHNFLAAVTVDDQGHAYAAVDITTGEWFHGTGGGAVPETVASAIAVFQPRELLWTASPESLLPRALAREFPAARREPAPPPVDPSELPSRFRDAFGPAEPLLEVDRRLAAYLKVTEPRLLPHLRLVPQGAVSERLALDAKTLRHLEIRRPMNPDDPSGPTLLDSMDETVTAPGRRTLAFWLTNPLGDVPAIVRRQEAVAALVERGAGVEEIRSTLRGVADLARIASRVAGRRVRPPELGALRDGLHALDATRAALGRGATSPLLERIAGELAPPPGLVELLDRALPEELPMREETGGLFRPGHAPDVDVARAAERTALDDLARLEGKEQAASGIKSLKIAYNQVFGFYFEVTRPHLDRVPAHFRRRQTVAQAERFSSDDLETLAHRILEARDLAARAETAGWEGFLADVERHVPDVHRTARAIGELDVLLTFSRLAQTRGYVRPVVDDSFALVLRDARHPVLERSQGAGFVPNDTDLDGERGRLVVLTGPNMSGKSTYMRQVGLLVVLAQAGAFVPARFARIGLVRRLFTRMGFTDEIGRGKSSFMVEMSEVAEILRGVDERSLVLLDEVGRGTSTFDGLALAWAILRHLHDESRARCLLATHYHQLTELAAGLTGARNAHLAVREGPEGIVFLHRLVPGSTDRSYGIHVARLAGLPPGVLREADLLLRRLEGEGIPTEAPGSSGLSRRGRYTQAVLLAEDAPAADRFGPELAGLDLDRMTPEEAHRRLRELGHRARGDGPTGREGAQ